MYVLIDGIRHEVKQDVQMVFENIHPEGGPEPMDLRIWAAVGQDGILVDVIEGDAIVIACTKNIDDLYDNCVRKTHEIKRLDTINVLEICGESGVNQLFSFEDDAEGQKKADETFLGLLKENKCEADETPNEEYLEAGKYDEACGYQILMVKSTS